MKWWGWMPWSLFLECWVLGQLFHSSFSPSSRGCLVLLCFLPLEWYHLHIWVNISPGNLFFFFFGHMACWILVPWPGIKPTPPVAGAWSLNHWTTREVLLWAILISVCDSFSVAHLETLSKHRCLPSPTVCDSIGLGRAWDCVFLAYFQMLMLLVQELHFELLLLLFSH